MIEEDWGSRGVAISHLGHAAMMCITGRVSLGG